MPIPNPVPVPITNLSSVPWRDPMYLVDGSMSTVWVNWFEDLRNRTGGFTGSTVYDASLLIDSELSGLQQQIYNNSAAGSNTELQFNDNGDFGASSALTWSGTALTVSTNTYPTNQGTLGDVLTTDGAGTASWVAPIVSGPAGLEGEVQRNIGGVFGANTDLRLLNNQAPGDVTWLKVGGPDTLSGDLKTKLTIGSAQLSSATTNTVNGLFVEVSDFVGAKFSTSPRSFGTASEFVGTNELNFTVGTVSNFLASATGGPIKFTAGNSQNNDTSIGGLMRMQAGSGIAGVDTSTRVEGGDIYTIGGVASNVGNPNVLTTVRGGDLFMLAGGGFSSDNQDGAVTGGDCTVSAGPAVGQQTNAYLGTGELKGGHTSLDGGSVSNETGSPTSVLTGGFCRTNSGSVFGADGQSANITAGPQIISGGSAISGINAIGIQSRGGSLQFTGGLSSAETGSSNCGIRGGATTLTGGQSDNTNGGIDNSLFGGSTTFTGGTVTGANGQSGGMLPGNFTMTGGTILTGDNSVTAAVTAGNLTLTGGDAIAGTNAATALTGGNFTMAGGNADNTLGDGTKAITGGSFTLSGGTPVPAAVQVGVMTAGSITLTTGDTAAGVANAGNVTISSITGATAGYIKFDTAALVIQIDGSGELQINTDPGVAGQVLTSTGAASAPVWATPLTTTPRQISKYTALRAF